MVLYFTGTGNSRYLARRIAEGLEMSFYDLNACIKAGNTAPVQTGRDVVLVTPTYAWRIPRVVSEWLGKTALTGAERIWFVMDCGSEIGNAAGYNRQLAAQKQLQYMGTAQIIMPENYIAMFNAPQKEQARSIVEQAEPALQKVLAQLKAGQEFPPPRENLYDRFMSGPVNPVFYRFFVKADVFRATDACIGCGKCVELCPLNNIHLENADGLDEIVDRTLLTAIQNVGGKETFTLDGETLTWQAQGKDITYEGTSDKTPAILPVVTLTLDGVPRGIDPKKVKQTMLDQKGVIGVHHLHIWALSTTENALTAHVVVDDLAEEKEIKHAVKDALTGVGIQHATLELEKSGECAEQSHDIYCND